MLHIQFINNPIENLFIRCGNTFIRLLLVSNHVFYPKYTFLFKYPKIGAARVIQICKQNMFEMEFCYCYASESDFR